MQYLVYLLYPVLLVQHRVHYQLGTVTLHSQLTTSHGLQIPALLWH